MAVNLANADGALKSVYLDVVSEQLDKHSNAFLAAIEHSTMDVVGKEVKKLVIDGINGGVGAGTEDGDLPKAKGNKYLQFTAPLKNLYGVIEISDKAVRASANDSGAFVNLLNAEMESLISASKRNFGRMLFGDGTGSLATIYMAGPGKNVTVDACNNLMEGMTVSFCNKGEVIQGFEEVKIVKINESACEIVIDKEVTEEQVGANSTICMVGAIGNELLGLKAIFDTSKKSLYGVNREGNAVMNPIIMEGVGDITETKLQKAIDTIELKSGTTPNLIICSHNTRRHFITALSETSTRIATTELESGYRTVSYNGIPIVADRFCPTGEVYILNTNDFVLHQLCDWEWLAGEDGSILRQVPGKPVYTATLVKYAELICNRPSAQCLLKSVTYDIE